MICNIRNLFKLENKDQNKPVRSVNVYINNYIENVSKGE